METPCPFCGAYTPRSCEFEGDEEEGCPWEVIRDEPDPDYLRELRDEKKQVDKIFEEHDE